MAKSKEIRDIWDPRYHSYYGIGNGGKPGKGKDKVKGGKPKGNDDTREKVEPRKANSPVMKKAWTGLVIAEIALCAAQGLHVLLAKHPEAWLNGTIIASIVGIAVLLMAIALGLAKVGDTRMATWLGKNGYESKEPPVERKHAMRRWDWTDFPIYYYNRNSKLVGGLNVEPYPYFIQFTLEDVKIKEFVEKSGLNEREQVFDAQRTEEQKAEWKRNKKGLFTMHYSTGLFCEEGKEKDAKRTMLSAVRASFHGCNMKEVEGKTARKTLAYYYGKEIKNVFVICKELGMQELAREHKPVYPMENDIVVGRVMDTETMTSEVEAGILHEHLEGGLCIVGGKPTERLATMKIVMMHDLPCATIIIDDRGDFTTKGAPVYEAGSNCQVNPLVPAWYDGNDAKGLFRVSSDHVENLVNALSLLLKWSTEHESHFYNRYQTFFETKSLKGTLPAISGKDSLTTDMEIGDERVSYIERGVSESVKRIFSSGRIWASEDVPRFDSTLLKGKRVIFDLSSIHGLEKRAFKAVLILKLVEFIKRERERGNHAPVLVVIPEMDKLFYDQRETLENTFKDKITKFVESLIDAEAWLMMSAQSISTMPTTMLQRMSSMISFRQVDYRDVKGVESLFNLESTPVYGNRNHAHQVENLKQLQAGRAYMIRSDKNHNFEIKVDVSGGIGLMGRKTLPVTAVRKPKTVMARNEQSLLRDLLGKYAVVLDEVVEALNRLKTTRDFGITRQNYVDYWKAVMEGSLLEKHPGLEVGAVKRKSKEMAEHLLDKLVHHDILRLDDFSGTGLRSDVKYKLTNFGIRLLENDETVQENDQEEMDGHQHDDDGGNEGCVDWDALYGEGY